MTTPAFSASVSDSDITWIRELLHLAPLDEPRRTFLNATSSMDVAACPGSGKTTLVVAKLALLARSWTARGQGICVLSHTNVAREEIQNRLGGTAVGGELLRYPHYIDTIHGFMNRFLAAPWLQSHGHQIIAIDNDITSNIRRKFLGPRAYRTLEMFLDRHHLSLDNISLVSTDFDHPLGHSFPSGPHTEMYKLASSAVADSAKRGYFRHDEMFVFARALLQQQPEVPAALQARFPYVLIDEMQDTDSAQMALLDQIFPIDKPDICVLRVGDPNQAIFEGTKPDDATFRNAATSITLANSFRFDGSIARLASRFANEPVMPTGLIGLRDTSGDEMGPEHTIFLFEEENIDHVIDSFATHVLASFPDGILRQSKIAVVGLVHKPVEATIVAGHKQFPKTVSHYWPDYKYSVKNKASHFISLIQYVWQSRLNRPGVRLSASAVDTFATGILHCSGKIAPGRIRIRSRAHKQLLELLQHQQESREQYLDFVVRFVLGSEPIDEDTWATQSKILLTVAQDAIGSDREQTTPAATDFFIWEPALNRPAELDVDTPALPPNVKRIEIEGRQIDVAVSSIHAVKGETHLATLVVETFSRAHYLKKLLPWLTGEKRHGQDAQTPADHSRLFSAYVAMTRATNLICLAFPVSTLGTGTKAQKTEQTLRDAGWKIVRI